MNGWELFLESLSTKGGNIFVLCIATFLLLVFMVHVSYHPAFGPEIRTLAISTFSGFSGALLNTLVGIGKRNGNGNDNPGEKKP